LKELCIIKQLHDIDSKRANKNISYANTIDLCIHSTQACPAKSLEGENEIFSFEYSFFLVRFV